MNERMNGEGAGTGDWFSTGWRARSSMRLMLAALDGSASGFGPVELFVMHYHLLSPVLLGCHFGRGGLYSVRRDILDDQ